MPYPNFMFASAVSAAATGDTYAADDAAIDVSDYYDVDIDADRIHFTRPIVDGQGFEFANPCARVRFVTNSHRIDVSLRYTNLITRVDVYNGQGAVYADGALVGTYTRGQGGAGNLNVAHEFVTSVSRVIEIVMPYCASVDFLGVTVAAGATFSAPSARPVKTLLVHGESIEQGFNGTSVEKAWPFITAGSLGVQLVNGGYGGRLAVASDGSSVGVRANLDGANSRILCCITANDCYSQVALATSKTAVAGFITNARAAAALAPIIMLSRMPIPALESMTIPLSAYRTKIAEAVSETAASNVHYIDGSAIGAPTSLSYFAADGIHYNDAGHALAAAAVATAISSFM